MAYILVVDTGSSSMRGVLFDNSGAARFTRQRRYSMQVEGDSAQYDPAVFADSLTDILRCCADRAYGQGEGIDAVAFTGQRSSILPLSKDGTPLCPVITWYDRRSRCICEEMNARFGRQVCDISGMRSSPVLSAPKIAWLKRERPDLYAAAYRIVGIQDYLLYLCTGVFFTDETLASRSHLMDVRTRQWSEDLLRLYGVDGDKLPRLVPPGTQVGAVTPSFSRACGVRAGTPVITSGGDQQCSALGMGIAPGGSWSLTCGSGAYIAAVTDRPVGDERMRVSLSAAVTPGQWVVEASTLSSGTVQDWLARTMFPGAGGQPSPEELHGEASRSPAGANGLIMLPDLAGKGCPDWAENARGAFLNIGLGHTRADFARAMLEGLAYEISECFDTLRGLLSQPDELIASGGLARSPLFCQMAADMAGVRVRQRGDAEATALGAFAAAACALGRYPSPADALASLPRDGGGALFTPDSVTSAAYGRAKGVRRALYGLLSSGAIESLH